MSDKVKCLASIADVTGDTFRKRASLKKIMHNQNDQFYAIK